MPSRGSSGRWEARPYLGGGFGHFYAYAPIKIEYAIDRFAMEVKRLLDVLDRRLAEVEYVAGSEFTIADIAIWPWYGGLVKGLQYGAAEFLSVQEYKNVLRWADAIAARPAVKRGRMVNRTSGEPSSQLHERHDASDFETKTQDKLVAASAQPRPARPRPPPEPAFLLRDRHCAGPRRRAPAPRIGLRPDARLESENRRSVHSDRRSNRCLRLLWYASLRTARASRGAVNVAAKALFLILTCLACIMIGFLLPMVPGLSAVIGSAFWAGLLASAGALAGMAVSDAILARIEQQEAAGPVSAGPSEAGEKTRPRH